MASADLPPLLGGLPAAEEVLVRARLRRRVVAVGERLGRAGSPVAALCLLIDAAASLRTASPDGRTIEVAVIGKGQALGAMAAIAGIPVPLEAVVLQAGHVIDLLPGGAKGLAIAAPVLFARLRQTAAEEVARISAAVRRQAFASARQRIANHLLETWYATERLLLPGNHEELAQMLAMRRATVTVALQELEERHAIRARRGYVEIVDPQRLEAEAFV